MNTKRNRRRSQRVSRRGRQGRRTQRGGLLIGNGNNTCVYNPPIDCTDGSEVYPGHVSRIVPHHSDEPLAQQAVQQAFTDLDPQYLPHFNFATKICSARFKASDLSKPCSVDALQYLIEEGPTSLINMITPIQESDINKSDGSFYKSPDVTTAAFKSFLHAVAEMNSHTVQAFHTDGHIGNISWKGNYIVLHDWERAVVDDRNLLATINGRLNWNFLKAGRTRAMLSQYPCWAFHAKLIGEIFDTQGLPPDYHFHLENTHQIYFRFWDTISVLIPIIHMYITAGLPPPTFGEILSNSITVYVKGIIAEEFQVKLNSLIRGTPVAATAVPVKARLAAITVKLHELIEEAFVSVADADAANTVSVNSELLKLVAAHANSSPAKQVLANMLPKVGGMRRRGF